MNNCWGCPLRASSARANVMQTIVENSEAAGIFVVASAGNGGSACSTVQDPPAHLRRLVLDRGDQRHHERARELQQPRPGDERRLEPLKPDISAPGASVRSSLRTRRATRSYGSMSGTSMAGPHVVGVVALLWSARPEPRSRHAAHEVPPDAQRQPGRDRAEQRGRLRRHRAPSRTTTSAGAGSTRSPRTTSSRRSNQRSRSRRSPTRPSATPTSPWMRPRARVCRSATPRRATARWPAAASTSPARARAPSPPRRRASTRTTSRPTAPVPYYAAPDVARTFAIAKASQTIDFAPLPDKTFGVDDGDFAVSATATSGLPVSFAAAGPCTVGQSPSTSPASATARSRPRRPATRTTRRPRT